MQRILFVAQNMAVGGIQTSLINLLNEICAGGEYEVHLFTFAPGALMDQVPETVQVTCGRRLLRLSATPLVQVLKSANIVDIALRIGLILWARLFGSRHVYGKMLRKYQRNEEYDVAVSYFNDVPGGYFNRGSNQYVSDYVRAKQKVAWIHNDPILGAFDRDACLHGLRSFDKIVCVSEAVRKKMEVFLPEYADHMAVFYNRFDAEKIRKIAQAHEVPFDSETFHIVTVARIDNLQKRIDGIVRLCARLRADGVEGFCWHVVGDGPDRAADEALAKSLNVSELICFEGETSNPYPFIKGANLFALYSAYEGFPMVVGEAQVLGTYILTTNYAAAQEQIAPEQGEIAIDDEDFYHKLKQLLRRHQES